jgi:hypothetical protein
MKFTAITPTGAKCVHKQINTARVNRSIWKWCGGGMKELWWKLNPRWQLGALFYQILYASVWEWRRENIFMIFLSLFSYSTHLFVYCFYEILFYVFILLFRLWVFVLYISSINIYKSQHNVNIIFVFLRIYLKCY